MQRDLRKLALPRLAPRRIPQGKNRVPLPGWRGAFHKGERKGAQNER